MFNKKLKYFFLLKTWYFVTDSNPQSACAAQEILNFVLINNVQNPNLPKVGKVFQSYEHHQCVALKLYFKNTLCTLLDKIFILYNMRQYAYIYSVEVLGSPKYL